MTNVLFSYNLRERDQRLEVRMNNWIVIIKFYLGFNVLLK